jgi:hypothetical protein
VFGGKVASVDAADAKRMPGVRDVIQISGWEKYQMPGGVAVNDLAPHVSRRTFMLAAAATDGVGIASAVGQALMGARRNADQIDRNRSQIAAR